MAYSYLTQKNIAEYKRTAQKRWQQKQRQLARLRERAWQVAKQAAAILKDQFAVTQVIVFGSLARGDLFHAHSDVDLAVLGLDERQYYRAIGCILSLEPTIPIDIVRMEDVPATLQATIKNEGVVLE